MPTTPRNDGTGFRSSKEEQFWKAWQEYGFPGSDITREFRFHPERRWRFDFAWPGVKVAVEIQGFGGGHQSIGGLCRDAEKWREAILLGWTVVPFTSACLGSVEKRMRAIADVCEIIADRFQEEKDGIEE